MMYLLFTIIAAQTAAIAYCIYKIHEGEQNKFEELVKDKPKGVLIDRNWAKDYFIGITDHADTVYMEVIELEKVGDGFSKIGFVKISGSLHPESKKRIKKAMPEIIETNKFSWSNN